MFSYMPRDLVPEIKAERKLLEDNFASKAVVKKSGAATLFAFVIDEKSPHGYSVFANNSKTNPKASTLSPGFYTLCKTIHGHFLALRSEINKTFHMHPFIYAHIGNTVALNIIEMGAEIYVTPPGTILLFSPRSGEFHGQMNKIYEIDDKKSTSHHAQQYAEKSRVPAVITFADFKAFGHETATPQNNEMLKAMDFFFATNGSWQKIIDIEEAKKYAQLDNMTPALKQDLALRLQHRDMHLNQKQFDQLHDLSLLCLFCFAKAYQNHLTQQWIEAATTTLANTPTSNTTVPLQTFTNAQTETAATYKLSTSTPIQANNTAATAAASTAATPNSTLFAALVPPNLPNASTEKDVKSPAPKG